MTVSEYYDLLREKHAQTDWSSRESIHAYNEYAKTLRGLLHSESNNDFKSGTVSQHPQT